MSKNNVYALLERIGNLCRSEERRFGKVHNLQPVHLHTLGYLGRANRYSKTPMAVAEYLGITKGTASQTVKALVRRGFVEQAQDKKDRRVTRLSLTTSGRRIISSLTPPKSFKEPIERLSSEVEKPLELLLRRLQQSGEVQSFGVCRTCRYHESKAGSIHCGLTGERLKQAESEQICREHQHV